MSDESKPPTFSELMDQNTDLRSTIAELQAKCEQLERSNTQLRHVLSDLMFQVVEWRGTSEIEFLKMDGNVGSSPLQKAINRYKACVKAIRES